MHNIFDLIKYKNNTAFYAADNYSLSYSDLNTKVDKLSEFLPERSLIFCFSENSVGSVVGYLSSLNSKCVAVLLDSSKPREAFDELLNSYSPNFLWVPTEKKDLFAGKAVFESDNYCLLQYSKDFVDMADDLALLLTTSGSTGSPKLVRLSYKNILSNAKSIVNYFQRESDKFTSDVLFVWFICHQQSFIGRSIGGINK